MTDASSRKATLLAVDDTPENLDVLTGVLKPEYAVKVAVNGEMALKIAEKHLPDLILLDVMMPGMDGYEVCRRLKAKPETASIPVIFVTARGDVTDEAMGFDVGAVDYITKPISPPIVRRRVATQLSLVRMEALNALVRSSIRMLGEAGHYSDADTGQHIWRMAAYARVLAEAMGWSRENVERLELAAPMHDMGKIGIPESILRAPRKLEPPEWDVMKTHPEIGHGILSQSSNPVFALAAEIALNHHERWDGTGYPRGLKGKDIPEAARIVSVVDVFDALTVKRPYKDAWSVDEAMEEITRNAGRLFDPAIVERFLEVKDTILETKKLWDLKEWELEQV